MVDSVSGASLPEFPTRFKDTQKRVTEQSIFRSARLTISARVPRAKGP
jgi:hypothetical protein